MLVKLRRLCFSIAIMTVVSSPVFGQGSLDHLQPYSGTYQLSDGRLLTGAPSDWVTPALLFVDPFESRAPYLFEQIEGDHFRSYPNGKTELRFGRDERGAVSTVQMTRDGKPALTGERFGHFNTVQLDFRSDGIELAGELRTPEGDGPFPVVVILHGSGPQSRYFGCSTSLYVSLGVAVFSYDKRGCGSSGGQFVRTDLDGFTRDARAAVEFLADRPEIDASRIGVQGNSESGWIIPEVAAEGGVAFMIARACPGTRVVETILHETRSDLAAAGAHDDVELAEMMALISSYYELVMQGASREDTTALLRSKNDRPWFARAAVEIRNSGTTEEHWRGFRERLAIDPAEGLRTLTIPILWFLAEGDPNVPHDASKSRIVSAVAEADNTELTFVSLPIEPHSFAFEDPTSPSGYRYPEGYWDRTASWMFEHTLTAEGVALPPPLAALKEKAQNKALGQSPRESR